MKKFTQVDPATGYRSFQKGPSLEEPDEDTRLATLPPERESQIRSAITSTKYGATLMKLGWAVRPWDDDFFTVLDVAARMGSGVGSFGVDRYYVLLKGTDELLEKSTLGHTAVVLDVKYEPPGAVTSILTLDEQAWYDILFPNDARLRSDLGFDDVQIDHLIQSLDHAWILPICSQDLILFF